MNVLLDTHAFLWWITDSPRLSDRARDAMADANNTLLWSVASSWEVAIKVALGRLTLAPPISRRVTKVHPALYTLFNLLPFLRTHVLGWIKKGDG